MTSPQPAPLTHPTARLAWRLLLATLLVAIGWLALTPNPPPATGLGWDKANHVLAFAALALCAGRGFGLGGGLALRVALALLVYGAAIELAQSQIPGRSAETRDLLADAVGIGIGLLLALGWARWIAGRFGRLTP